MGKGCLGRPQCPQGHIKLQGAPCRGAPLVLDVLGPLLGGVRELSRTGPGPAASCRGAGGEAAGQHHPAAGKRQGDRLAKHRVTLPRCFLPFLLLKNPKRGKLQGEQPGRDVGLGHQSTRWLWERAWGCPALPCPKPPECAHRARGLQGGPTRVSSGTAASWCLLAAALSGRPACRAASPQKQIDSPQSEPRSKPGLEHRAGTEHQYAKSLEGIKIWCENK